MADADPSWQHAVARLRERLGIDGESSRLSQALTHPSFANEQKRDAPEDNQRLEFLGDAVLGLCVSEMLMDAFGDVDEGELTLMRAALVNAEALADSARWLELGAALRLGRGADSAGERSRDNVLADALEAVIGAVFLDFGLDRAREVSRIALSERISKLVADGGIQRDAKSRLQELVQSWGFDTPSYSVIDESGPPHQREFTVAVTVVLGSGDEQRVVNGEGSGRSKKLAEQSAAMVALDQLSAEPPSDGEG